MKNINYILNPDYTFKNDLKRVILYAKSQPAEYSSKSWFSIIHPVQAMILSFFSKERTLDEAIRLICLFLEISDEEAKTKIMPFIENAEPLKNSYKGHNFYFPKMLIIKANRNKCEEFSPEEMICEGNDFVTKRLYSGPLMLTLMLSNQCVTKCCYCYADTSSQVENPLSTDKILDLIKEAKAINMNKFNLIGGEVFLHKNWNVILKELVKNDFYPDIISTKVPITEKIISKLENAKYSNNIQISLDSMSSDSLEQSLYVNKGYIDRVKKGIYLLDNNNINYQIATILTTYNDSIESMSSMYNFIKSLKKIKSWRIAPAMNSLYKNYQEFSNIKTNREKVENVYFFIEKEIKPQANFDIILDHSYLDRNYFSSEKGSEHFAGSKCSALNNHLFILPDGKVTICEQLYWNKNFIIGDIKTNTLTQIWNSPQALRLAYMKKEYIDKKSKCYSCGQFQNCFDNRNRCWTDIIKAYGDEHWDYPDPRCKKAPQMIQELNF